MKKTFLSMLMIASFFSVANAQLVVDNNGHVGVAVDETSTMSSYLGVNSTGSPLACFYVASDPSVHRAALSARRLGNNTTLYNQYQMAGHFLTEVYPSQYNIGLYSECFRNDAIDKGRTYGLLTFAGNATDGWNFGVCASLKGSNNGAAIYGSSEYSLGDNTNGRYAGFFAGDVRVTETLTASNVVTPADYRLKKNIQEVRNGNLNNIMDINVVQYNYLKKSELAAMQVSDDTIAVSRVSAQQEELNKPEVLHYGFIAQELQKIYPHLVYEGQDGYLSINYMEMIPLLVSSIQELKTELNNLQKGNIYRVQASQNQNIEALEISVLYQNTPNPFTESTLIQCDIAVNVTDANLYIYNMNGDQIAEFAITERGSTSVTIDGGSLNAGMYLYALIADGQVIDTKRMILTK